MPFVVDCSVALSWLLPDEHHAAADSLLGRLLDDVAIVPSIWYLEVANGLLSALNSKRLTVHQFDVCVERVEKLGVQMDQDSVEQLLPDILHISQQYRLTSYDASYIESAARNKLPFATLDKKLRAAAIKHGVEVLL